jgi:Tfp pilus assembly protein PilO
MVRINKTSSVALFFSVIFLAIVGIVIGPLVLGIEDIGTNIKEQDQNMLVLEERIAKAKEFRAFRAENEKDLAKLEKALVKAEMPLDFINFLEDVSKECQVISSFSPIASPKAEKDGLPAISFQVVITGNFSSAMKFLKKIESGPYLIQIGNLTIKNELGDVLEEGGAQQGQVRMDLSLKAYAKKQI